MADIPLDPRLQAQLLDLYRMSGDRIASTQPVHDAAMAMATRLAPGYARSAMRPAPTPSAPLTTGSTGGSSTGRNVAAAALASMLGGGPGAGGDIGKLIQQLIKLFRGHGRDTVQGNQPFPGGALTGGGQPSQYPFPGFAPNDGGDSQRGGNPNVSTGIDFSLPNDILNDPTLLNSYPAYPTDPSGGTGVGPGMQGYRTDTGSGGGTITGTNWWDE